MTSNEPSQEKLADEFRQLGKNLTDVLRAAWESQERKQLQQEIESGLRDLGAAFKKETEGFRESPTGQRVKSEFDDVRERVRSGEAESRLRADLLAALRAANQALQRASARWADQAGEPSQPEAQNGPKTGE